MDLQRALGDGFASACARRRAARALGELVRRMHDAGVDQDDLAPNNFLWRAGCEPPMLAIDFERTRLRTRVSERARAASLAKLARHCAGESAPSRMRFLLAYSRGDRAEARRRWRDVETEARALLVRDVRRWTRTATRRGRRFEPIELTTPAERWCGWARRSADRALLEAALGSGARHESVWMRELGALSSRRAAAAWGVAQALHQRGACPEPLALLRSKRRAVVLWARPAASAPLDRDLALAARSALVVWMDRLHAIGVSLRRDAALAALAGSLDGRRVGLLDPLAVELDPLAAGGRARARARVQHLLADHAGPPGARG